MNFEKAHSIHKNIQKELTNLLMIIFLVYNSPNNVKGTNERICVTASNNHLQTGVSGLGGLALIKWQVSPLRPTRLASPGDPLICPHGPFHPTSKTLCFLASLFYIQADRNAITFFLKSNQDFN